MKQSRGCKFCGSKTHNTFNCFNKHQIKLTPKKIKPMKLESAKSNQKRAVLRNSFFELNKPNNKGLYECYLKISPYCRQMMPRHYVTIEHVYPKNSGKYPELKYIPENTLPACEFCNKSKRSNTPEQLAIFYPHILEMLDSIVWQDFMQELKRVIELRNIELYWNDEYQIFRRYKT